MKILIIDNYDSFTFNLYQLCGEIINKNSIKTNNNILVKRNDELTINDIKKIKPDKIIISPGPGSPEQKKYFGICQNIILELGPFTPILGICLGMQLLLETSQEFGTSNGLGLINGKVVKFSENTQAKLPHVSWNSLVKGLYGWESGLLDGISEKDDFYFVHSFICQPEESKNILAYSSYGGQKFCAVIQKDNIYGCQFHPEKSSKMGLKILKNFIKISSQ